MQLNQLAVLTSSTTTPQQTLVVPLGDHPRRAAKTPASASARLGQAVGISRPGPTSVPPVIPRVGVRTHGPLAPTPAINRVDFGGDDDDGDQIAGPDEDDDLEDLRSSFSVHDAEGKIKPSISIPEMADDRRTVPSAKDRVSTSGKFTERVRSARGVCTAVAGASGKGTWCEWIARVGRSWGTRNTHEANALCYAIDCLLAEGIDPDKSDAFETLVCRMLALDAMERGKPTEYVDAVLWNRRDGDQIMPRSLDKEARHEALLVAKLENSKTAKKTSGGGGGSGGNKKKNQKKKGGGGTDKKTEDSKRTGTSSGAQTK